MFNLVASNHGGLDPLQKELFIHNNKLQATVAASTIKAPS
jgi:hypothetical protein